MDPINFDRLTRLFGRSGTRRAALSALLGLGGLESALGTAAAKPESYGQGKPNGKGKRRGKHKRKGKRKGRARAQAKTKAGNHCISPIGLDLNEFYDISAQIVAPFCTEVGSGEQWLVAAPWFVEHSFVTVPAGFVPAEGATTPLEDFIAKFSAVKYVIDPGTRQEQTVVFPNDEPLFTAELAVDDGLVRVVPGTHDPLHPLPVGTHTVDIYWVFSAMHCDGIGDDPTPGQNCFPAGETKYLDGLEFEVTPGHH